MLSHELKQRARTHTHTQIKKHFFLPSMHLQTGCFLLEPPPPKNAHFGAQQILFSQLLTAYATCSKLLTILEALLYRH